MNNTVNITFKDGQKVQIEKGMDVKKFALQMASKYPYPIMLGKVSNILKELRGTLDEDLVDFE